MFDNDPEEEAYLEDTISFIDDGIETIKRRSPAHAAYKEAARELQIIDDQTLEAYVDARPRPYFGRVDFMTDGDGKNVKGYVGPANIGKRVWSWASPFARAVFYAKPEEPVNYKGPRGQIKGRITLKRQIEIADARLLSVTETYRRLQPGTPTELIEDQSEHFLIEQLSQPRGRELRETVATIQPDQYQQIAAASTAVMQIQGVAGSGKSIVGLHRIAYLLSPFNQRERIDPARVVFFGPTSVLLSYVGNLLPSLNVQDVRQLTVSNWMIRTMSQRISMGKGEPLLEKLLRDKSGSWQPAHHAAKLKGSLEFARTLERHVETLRKQFVSKLTGPFTVRPTTASQILIDESRVKREARSVAIQAINLQRRRVVTRLVNAAWDIFTASERALNRRVRVTQREFTEVSRPQLEQLVAQTWPELDFRTEYRRLMNDPGLLRVSSRGGIGSTEASLLRASLPKGPMTFRADDVGALRFLDDLLNGQDAPEFDHIVLDEAQEISPIELLVIKGRSRGNGFTILGDLTQSLSPQGIERWGEILQLFRGSTISRYVVRTSYRSTEQLTRFANRILKQASGSKAPTAKPFKRQGPPPSFRPSASYSDMVSAIAADLSDLRARDFLTIGILCKSSADARKLHDLLRQHGATHVGLLKPDNVPDEDAVVAEIALTRGLEYDAVILAGVSSDHYPPTPLHSKLLYLGVTRAAHDLRIHWAGKPASQLAVRSSRKRRHRRIGRKRPRRRAVQ